MSDLLSDDDLHELVKSARGAKPKRTSANADDRPAVTYDFKKPQPLNKELFRRLEGLHEQLARSFAATLSGSMRMVVDIDLAYCEQQLYHEFVLSLPNPCSAYSYTIEPFGGRAVLSFTPEVLMALVDRSFGGQGRGLADDGRALTPIEMGIVGKLVSRAFRDLEEAWEPLARIEVADAALETNPEFIQIAAPADGVLVVGLELNSKNVSGLLHLCYPVLTLDPLVARLGPAASNEPQGARRQRREADLGRNEQSLRNMMMPVEVEVATGSLPLNQLADLQVGDVVKLDTQKDEPAVVFIGDRPKYRGRVGLQGRKRAVQIIEEIRTDEEHLYR